MQLLGCHVCCFPVSSCPAPPPPPHFSACALLHHGAPGTTHRVSASAWARSVSRRAPRRSCTTVGEEGG